MSKVKDKNQAQKEEAFSWKETIVALLNDFMHNLGESIANNIKSKIKEGMNGFKKIALGSVLIALGLTMFFTGLAMRIDAFFGHGMGFISIGFITVLIGWLVFSFKNNK